MRASQVLQKCLSDSLGAIHKARVRVLLRAVEALVAGRRLTLIDVARSWPGALRVRAPLKVFDRLLSNPHLHAERESIHADIGRWLLSSPQPIIVIDWSAFRNQGRGQERQAGTGSVQERGQVNLPRNGVRLTYQAKTAPSLRDHGARPRSRFLAPAWFDYEMKSIYSDIQCQRAMGQDSS